jgi:hypothetical protein
VLVAAPLEEAVEVFVLRVDLSGHDFLLSVWRA